MRSPNVIRSAASAQHEDERDDSDDQPGSQADKQSTALVLERRGNLGRSQRRRCGRRWNCPARYRCRRCWGRTCSHFEREEVCGFLCAALDCRGKCLCKRRAPVKPLLGRLRHCTADDGDHRARDIGTQSIERGWQFVEMLEHQLYGAVCIERQPSGNHLIRQYTERVLVRGRGKVLTLPLLRRHIRRRTHHHACAC